MVQRGFNIKALVLHHIVTQPVSYRLVCHLECISFASFSPDSKSWFFPIHQSRQDFDFNAAPKKSFLEKKIIENDDRAGSNKMLSRIKRWLPFTYDVLEGATLTHLMEEWASWNKVTDTEREEREIERQRVWSSRCKMNRKVRTYWCRVSWTKSAIIHCSISISIWRTMKMKKEMKKWDSEKP